MRNARFVLTLVGVMVLGTAGGGASQTFAAAVEQADPRAVFLQRVDAYVDLHRRLEVGLPPQVVTADLERLFEPTLALAREIRRVRADARQGDGSAFDVIIYDAKAVGADLIVMGTHGRSGLSHLVLGSVAERVIRGAHCPVLAVRASEGARQVAGAAEASAA